MKKLISCLALASLVFGLTAQAQKKSEKNKSMNATKDETVTTASGLKIKITQKTTGAMPKAGDKVRVHYTGKLTNDSVFDSSVSRGEPISFKLGVGQVIPGWDEGIALMHKGEKATLYIPYALAYGEQGRPPVIPAKADLIFDVELVDFTESIAPKVFDVKGKDTLKTASGLQYIMVKKVDSGLRAESGKNVTVHYSGYFTDGKMFDSSVERGDPFSFGLGQHQVIAGWDEGISLLRVGEKARLIVPYSLGYGENAYGPIPAKSTLIFDVELLEVK